MTKQIEKRFKNTSHAPCELVVTIDANEIEFTIPPGEEFKLKVEKDSHVDFRASGYSDVSKHFKICEIE